MVSIDSALIALSKAAMIAGATASGGPAAGALMTRFLQTPPGEALARKIVSASGGDATPFALGGLVTEPTLALVGEEGPEMIIPVLSKPKRKVSAYARRYKKAFKQTSMKFKLRNGSWKKNGFKLAVKAAHKMAGTKKGQVRKTARRAFKR